MNELNFENVLFEWILTLFILVENEVCMDIFVLEIAKSLEHKPLHLLCLMLVLPKGNIRLEVEVNTKRFMSLVYS